MRSQRTLKHQFPAWVLVIVLLFMGSGWTFGGWNNSVHTGNAVGIGQYNHGYGNYRYNWASGSSSGSGCWGCFVPPSPCPPPPPPPCWSCPAPEPEPDPQPEPEPTPAGKCKGVKSLTLQYNGEAPTTVQVSHKGDILGTFNVAPGETFTVSGESEKKGKLPAEITLSWDGREANIHTSCSKPIDVGDVHGDFQITDLEKVYEQDHGHKDKGHDKDHGHKDKGHDKKGKD